MSELLVSIDLDDAWAYLRARDIPGWEQAPTIVPLATARLLEVLEAAGIGAATTFVVGRDAREPHGVDAVRRFAATGYEIADHSLAHRGELASCSIEEIRADLEASRSAIAEASGSQPTGFRCPSFGASPALSSALTSLGYGYDASALPTTLMPLLRLYHRVSAGAGDHAPSYGNLRTAFASLRPRRQAGVLSIPTTTVPIVRTPFHASYLSALATRSAALARSYAWTADRLCRLWGLPVSFLLHPTDVLDVTDAPHLGFFPGMQVPWSVKRPLMVAVLSRLSEDREVLDLGAYGDRLVAVETG